MLHNIYRLGNLISILFFLKVFVMVRAQMTVSDFDAFEPQIETWFDTYMASFASNPATCMPLVSTATILKTFSVDCSDTIFNGDCAVVIVQLDTPTPSYGVFFRYAHNVSNFIANANTLINNGVVGWGRDPTSGEFGQVGENYKTAFTRLVGAGLIDYMQELWAIGCARCVVSIGHGAGCGLAEMFALYLRKMEIWDQDGIYLLAFAAPRTGNQEFAAKLSNSVWMPYRIYWLNDPIGMYPPTPCPRTAQPNINSALACWFHFGYAFRYTSYTSSAAYAASKCSLAEDATCDDTSSPNNPDHYSYFNYDLSNFDQGVCKSP